MGTVWNVPLLKRCNYTIKNKYPSFCYVKEVSELLFCKDEMTIWCNFSDLFFKRDKYILFSLIHKAKTLLNLLN